MHRYISTPLDPVEADHLIMEMYRTGAISAAQISQVNDAHEDDGSVAGLYVAAVSVAHGSEQMHLVLDGFCEDRATILS